MTSVCTSTLTRLPLACKAERVARLLWCACLSKGAAGPRRHVGGAPVVTLVQAKRQTLGSGATTGAAARQQRRRAARPADAPCTNVRMQAPGTPVDAMQACAGGVRGRRPSGPSSMPCTRHDELGHQVHVVVPRGAQLCWWLLPGPEPLVQLRGWRAARVCTTGSEGEVAAARAAQCTRQHCRLRCRTGWVLGRLPRISLRCTCRA